MIITQILFMGTLRRQINEIYLYIRFMIKLQLINIFITADVWSTKRRILCYHCTVVVRFFYITD